MNIDSLLDGFLAQTNAVERVPGIIILVDYYFIPIYERYVSFVDTRLNGRELQNQSMDDIVEAFYAKPLQEMKSLSACPRTTASYSKLIKKITSLY